MTTPDSDRPDRPTDPVPGRVVDHRDELVVRRSRGNAVPLLVACVLFAATDLLDLRTDRGWTAVAIGAVLTIVVVIAVLVALEIARSGPRSTPLLRIGPTGLHVAGADPVPWSDIDSVRLTRGRRGGAIRAVAFLPRTGRTVPATSRLGLRTVPGGGSRDRVVARYGSVLVVLPGRMTATAL